MHVVEVAHTRLRKLLSTCIACNHESRSEEAGPAATCLPKPQLNIQGLYMYNGLAGLNQQKMCFMLPDRSTFPVAGHLQVSVRGSRFDSNNATLGGGGVIGWRTASFELINTTFSSNLSPHGAAVCLADDSSAIIRGLVAFNNSASAAGGAVEIGNNAEVCQYMPMPTQRSLIHFLDVNATILSLLSNNSVGLMLAVRVGITRCTLLCTLPAYATLTQGWNWSRVVSSELL